MRKRYNIWVTAGKPTHPKNRIYINRLESRKQFRREVRIEQARRKNAEKDRIMQIRTKDMHLFHLLVRKNRTRGNFIMDLHVGEEHYIGEENILAGFKRHFQKLSSSEETNNQEDAHYHRHIEYEIQIITEIVKDKNIPAATSQELKDAIKSINKGKSPDIYDITIEHIVHAGNELNEHLLNLINVIFQHGTVPDRLKAGLLTPVFKNKGDKNIATNRTSSDQ